MPNKEAEKALQLGHSYVMEVLDNIEEVDKQNKKDKELAERFIRKLNLAIEQFDIANKLDPDLYLENGQNAIAGKSLSWCLIGSTEFNVLGEREIGIKSIQKAIEIDEDFPLSYHLLATSYIEIGLKELAIENIDKAIELDPDNHIYKDTKSDILNMTEAEQSIRRGYCYLFDVWHRETQIFNQDGSCKDVELAKHLINKLNLALEQFDNADRTGRKLVLNNKMNSTDGTAESFATKGFYQYAALGIKDDAIGIKDDAIVNLKIAINYSPNNALVNHYYGCICITEGENEKGLYHIRKAVELEPNHTIFRETLNRFDRRDKIPSENTHSRSCLLNIYFGLLAVSFIGLFMGNKEIKTIIKIGGNYGYHQIRRQM